ncbi:MAG: hypothetical protein LBU89_10960 [Fibromonadaceae bacterium]|nr:hypothetical protein [Fibromonadaceae bacterium]
MDENNNCIGVGAFVRNAIKLPNNEFEKEMRLDNDDESIDNVEMITLTEDAIEAYERC